MIFTNSSLPTCPLREEKSFSQRAFSIYMDIRKLQDKAKTSYTLSTRRLRFGYCLLYTSVQFYNHLTKKQELKINTLETINTLLHPTFQLAVRDDIIRKNPTDGVMAELKKNLGMKTGVRPVSYTHLDVYKRQIQ